MLLLHHCRHQNITPTSPKLDPASEAHSQNPPAEEVTPASEVLVANGIVAATDVTGFGLLGHSLEMARAAGARFVFEAAALPALPGALALAAAGVETGGAAHNRRFVAPALTVADGAAPEFVTLAVDPQTSGGLLAAVPGAQVDAITRALNAVGVQAWRVGHVEAGQPAVELR